MIVCKPTTWFKTRAIGLGLLLLGFGLYFFYDATTGYPQKNEVFFMHKTFEAAGQTVEKAYSADQWKQIAAGATIDFKGYPVSSATDPQATPWPAELANYDLMKQGWNEAWTAYTGRMHLPLKPVDTPFDDGKIREQWIAGSISCALALFCAFLLIRTMGRVMSIDGENVTAAGTRFSVKDITRLDMRKWKHKGIAYAYLGEKRVRLDGFCYGGFSKEDHDQNAEAFIQALLASYQGDIIDYEDVSSSTNDE